MILKAWGSDMEASHSEEMAVVNLDRLQSWIDQGRINPSRPITMIELLRSGCISSVRDGIKLLARVRLNQSSQWDSSN
jgi:large subunit ribosomal protein L15